MSMRLALCIAALLGAASAAEVSVPDGACSLTFVEVRGDAAARAQHLLRDEVRTLHRDAPAVSMALLEEVGRPERFLIVEESAGSDAARPPPLATLTPDLTAPPDHRANRAFATGTSTGPLLDNRTLYVAAHIDIGPPNLARGEALLRQLAQAGQASPGNLRFDVWRQTDRANHFNLIAVWRTRQDFDAFTASAPSRDFRAGVASLLGSLYDDRLYRRLGE
jgi:quinol monooxygenase YgiN